MMPEIIGAQETGKGLSYFYHHRSLSSKENSNSIKVSEEVKEQMKRKKRGYWRVINVLTQLPA